MLSFWLFLIDAATFCLYQTRYNLVNQKDRSAVQTWMLAGVGVINAWFLCFQGGFGEYAVIAVIK